jgi:hypothetical protein
LGKSSSFLIPKKSTSTYNSGTVTPKDQSIGVCEENVSQLADKSDGSGFLAYNPETFAVSEAPK